MKFFAAISESFGKTKVQTQLEAELYHWERQYIGLSMAEATKETELEQVRLRKNDAKKKAELAAKLLAKIPNYKASKKSSGILSTP